MMRGCSWVFGRFGCPVMPPRSGKWCSPACWACENEPQREWGVARRNLLESVLAAPEDPLRLSPLLQASAGEVLEAVRKLGLEGVVGKRIGSTYEPGKRSGAWIKHRVNREQEFVIGGYIPGAGGFDALLVGVYERKRVIFVAKVKNGFVSANSDSCSRRSRRCKSGNAPSQICPRKGPRGGRIANRGENGPMPLGQTETGLPDSLSSNGPTPGTCGIAYSLACAMTRRLLRCRARRRRQTLLGRPGAQAHRILQARRTPRRRAGHPPRPSDPSHRLGRAPIPLVRKPLEPRRSRPPHQPRAAR